MWSLDEDEIESSSSADTPTNARREDQSPFVSRLLFLFLSHTYLFPNNLLIIKAKREGSHADCKFDETQMSEREPSLHYYPHKQRDQSLAD